MKHLGSIVLSGSLALLGLAACGTGEATPSAPACPARFTALPGADQPGDKACSCGPDAARGTVWGSGIYTTDSSICGAAVHAGVIGAKGGVVKVTPAKGCEAYEGSEAHGVTSQSWGSWGTSFTFAGVTATCATPKAPPPPPAQPASACPSTFLEIPDRSASTSITCACPATATGAIYGNGIYTIDSSLCAAAVHAGVIGAQGGTITAQAAPGCDKYESVAANGITSASWGAYGASFVFPARPGTCAR